MNIVVCIVPDRVTDEQGGALRFIINFALILDNQFTVTIRSAHVESRTF